MIRSQLASCLRRRSGRIRASMTTRDSVAAATRMKLHRPSVVPAVHFSTSTDDKAWQASRSVDIQRVTQQAMIHELTMEQTQTIQKVVPWFLKNMPDSYFRQVPEKFRMDHIKAIAAIQQAGMEPHLNLKSQGADNSEIVTMIRPGTQTGKLLQMVKELPYSVADEVHIPLSRAQVFCADDDSVSLNVFVFGRQGKDGVAHTDEDLTDVERARSAILDYAKTIQDTGETTLPGVKSLSSLQSPCDWSLNQPRSSPLFERAKLLEYFTKCSKSYIEKTDPRRFLRQRELFELVSGTEGTAVVVEDSEPTETGKEAYWINMATANSLGQQALLNASRLLTVHNLDIMNAHLDVISDGDNGTVTMLRMHVAPVRGEYVPDETFEDLARVLKRAKWLDDDTLDLVLDRYPWLGVNRGEIITAFCSLLHPIMSKQNAFIFSKTHILDTVTRKRYISHAAAIADLFLERFDPNVERLSKQDFTSQCQALRTTIENDVEDSIASTLLVKMIDIVCKTLKTNIFMEDRYSLGFRLDPAVMVGDGDDRELPYGILFAHGRRFNAFHVRFRDIARGGLRLVTPPTSEQFALESSHQYDECYGLAFAQQLKNKDIPEGGSKAVNLINTVGLSDNGKNFVMRKAVKAFTDTILDLIVQTPETEKKIVDYFRQKEVLYLGPDEQVIPVDIDWVVSRAGYRGYDTPAAFMSSKPRAGINHKEFGVTSEGVNVYLDVALRKGLGIDPQNTSFSVKMTGGPDGDVAGNEIKILIREYGDNVKIVGVADHSGCAEDPNGLDHEELLRLVKSGLCISHFDASKVSADGGGAVHLVNTEEGVKMRNSMHNRLEADAFLPCGGRPNTIDISNYKNFLKADGTPSAPLIVEGANLFVTHDARKALFDEAGVLIVKDSSANKGGVITSSYEICAAMMLSEDDFVENKGDIVSEVLAKLRGLAHLEASLLFREFEMYGGSLPEMSQVISNAINVTTDVLTNALDELSESDREQLLPLFRAHLPQTLADMSFDKVHERVPEQYIKNAIASGLASKMVYKEGTKFIEAQSKQNLAKIALKYVEKEKEIAVLATSLESSGLPEAEKTKIIELLHAGGARTALGVF